MFALSSVDSTPLFYERWGAPREGRAPLLLLDGVGCDGYVWRYVRRDFTDREVVHGHYRGHGRTPIPDDFTQLTLADLADDAASVLDDAQLAKAVVVGHSMGVQVALEFYRRHADRVRGLALLCGAPSHPLRTFGGSAALERALPQVQQVVARFPRAINHVLKRVMPTRLAYEIAARTEIRRDAVDPVAFMPYLEGMAQIDARLFVTTVAAMNMHSAEDMLASVAVPTLVVAGGKDGFTPPERSREMAARIPQAVLLELPNGSHTAPLEEPERISVALSQLLARVDAHPM